MCKSMNMAKEFVEYFTQCVTLYNWPLCIVTVMLLYPTVLHHYNIKCCNTVTKLFHLKLFSFSTYIKHFMNDVISAATFQGCRANILAAHWYSVIHSTDRWIRMISFFRQQDRVVCSDDATRLPGNQVPKLWKYSFLLAGEGGDR